MPYAPVSGIYTAPAAALPAAPGQVIASANWNTIFTDISTALTQLGEASSNIFVKTPRVASAGSFTVIATDVVVYVTASAPTIFVPSCTVMQAPVRIIGTAGTIFGTAKSVLVPSGGETFNGSATYTLSLNYQVAVLYNLPSGGFIVA